MNEAVMALFRQYVEHKKAKIMRQAADKLGGKVEGDKIVLTTEAANREYNEQAFISKTLNDVGIRPR